MNDDEIDFDEHDETYLRGWHDGRESVTKTKEHLQRQVGILQDLLQSERQANADLRELLDYVRGIALQLDKRLLRRN